MDVIKEWYILMVMLINSGDVQNERQCDIGGGTVSQDAVARV